VRLSLFGELEDDVWHVEIKKETDFLRSLGASAHYFIEPGQAHGIQSLARRKCEPLVRWLRAQPHRM
jgi:hypothetical protein